MKKIWNVLIFPLIGLAIGFVFYMAYIHVISWLTVPIGILVLIGLVFLVLATIYNVINFFIEVIESIIESRRKKKGSL